MAAGTTILKALIERFGEQGLIQEAKALQKGAVATLKDIKPETIDRLATRRQLIKGEGALPSEEEAQAFGKAIEQGSDVAPEYREKPTTLTEAINAPDVPDLSGFKYGGTRPEEPLLLGARRDRSKPLETPDVIYAGPGREGPRFDVEGVEAPAAKVNYGKAELPSESVPSPVSAVKSVQEAEKGLSRGQKLGLGAGVAAAGGAALSASGTNSDFTTQLPTDSDKQYPKMSKFNKLAANFPGEPSLEETEAKDKADAIAANTGRLASLEQSIAALQGVIKADPSNPNPTVLKQLEEFSKEKTRLTQEQEALKRPAPGAGKPGEAVPAAPMRGQGPIASGEEYGKRLRDQLSKDQAKKPSVPAAPAAAPVSREGNELQRKIAGLGEELTKAKSERDEARGKVAIGELAELVGKSLTQMGAAYTGLQTGTNLSNLIKDMPSIDWASKRKEITDDYRSTVEQIDSQQKTLQRAVERSEDKAERAATQKRLEQLERDKMAQTDSYQKQVLGVRRLEVTNKFNKAIEKFSQERQKALQTAYAAFESGDAKAQAEALKGLSIEEQKIVNEAGGWFKPSKAEAVAGLVKQTPAVPAATPATGGAAKQLTMAQVQAVAARDRLSVEAAKQKLIDKGYTIAE